MPRNGRGLTEIADPLPKHDTTLEHAKDGRPPQRRNQFACDDIGDQTGVIQNVSKLCLSAKWKSATYIYPTGPPMMVINWVH